MARFSFNIKGTFETDETSLALLQLSHLAEITKANISDKVKFEFTDIHVQKDEESPIGKELRMQADFGPGWAERPVQMGLVGSNVMQDDLDKQ